MKFFYPPKPMEMFATSIEEKFDQQPGRWIAQEKYDGWRTLIIKDSAHKIVQGYNTGNKNWARGTNKDLFFLSHRGMKKGGPTNQPVSENIVAEIEKLNLPDGSMIDSEWLARRTIGEIPECSFVFDILWLKDEWLGETPYQQRHDLLWSMIPTDFKHIKTPVETTKNFQELYTTTKARSWTEGMVMKDVGYTIIANRTECEKTSQMVKIKYRSGASGRDEFNLKG